MKGEGGTKGVGDFNPYRENCGFYPPAIVSRLGPVIVLGTRRKFSDGHKRLYQTLVHKWGRKGPCFPSVQYLASELGRSRHQVMRWLEDLICFGLIASRRRGRGPGGRGQTNEYTFLWHPIFEVAGMGGNTVLKSQIRAYDVAERPALKSQNEQRLYQEENTQEKYAEETSSSSSEWAEPNAALPPKPTTKTTRPPTMQEAHHTHRWWTPEAFAGAGGLLNEQRRAYSPLPPPDPGVVAAILPNMQNLEDMRMWLASNRVLFGQAKTWGAYITDSKHWPSKRADAAAQIARVMQANRCQHGCYGPYCEQCGDERKEAELVAQARKAEEERLAAERTETVTRPPTAEELEREMHRQERVAKYASQTSRWYEIRRRQRESWKDDMDRHMWLFDRRTIEQREEILNALAEHRCRSIQELFSHRAA